VSEELEETRELLNAAAVHPAGAPPVRDEAHERITEELGDLLFSCVNLCRKAQVHASLALDRANLKFQRRFEQVEQLARARGIEMGTASLAELDTLWDEVKLR
jgi:nucleoside triphosphate diphosphatase